MKHAVTRELFAYWTRLRAGRVAPERGDIDPAAIRGLLCDTFVLEVGGAPARLSYAIRLSGTRLNALFLRELKGEDLLALWSPDERAAVPPLLEGVVEDCTPVIAGLRAGPEGHRPIDLEMILLPLRHHGRTHARVLGAIAPLELPSWMGLLAVQGLHSTSHRSLGPETPTIPERLERVVTRLAAQPRRVGHLVVHEGGR